MKILGLFVITLMSQLSFASTPPPGPFEDKCNRDAALRKIEKSVVDEIRREVDAEDKSYTYSFQFSPVWRGENRSDMTVYFEKVWDHTRQRRGYVAQYSISKKTCAPRQMKFQALYMDAENPAGLATSSPTPEPCNDPKNLSALHQAIIDSQRDLLSKSGSSDQADNFRFSGTLRTAGASDMIAVFELTRPGLLATPMVAQVAVDPATCHPSVLSATDPTWLLIKY